MNDKRTMKQMVADHDHDILKLIMMIEEHEAKLNTLANLVGILCEKNDLDISSFVESTH
jgi:hypothetical protein